MARIIFHIDLNSFFASAEVLLNPELKGKPIVVAHDGPRSVVSTASYEARQYGIKSGMPLVTAKKKCKDLIVVEHHGSLYRQYSNQFMAVIQQFTPMVEPVSIDEAFADMSDTIKRYKRPLDLAVSLQDMVKTTTGLDCSIGIAPNRFLAKMASDMKKPRGITILRKRDVPSRLWPLPIAEMQWIGKKSTPKLKALGIQTIGDLANYPKKEDLINIFGSTLDTVLNHANGNGDDHVGNDETIKSMSQVSTMEVSLQDYGEVKNELRRIAQSLSQRLFKADRMGYGIGITIRSDDFSTITRQIQLTHPIYKADDLYTMALSIFDQQDDHYPIRLIGIFLNHLVSIHHGNIQLNLFDDSIDEVTSTRDLVKTINTQLKKGGHIELASVLMDGNTMKKTNNDDKMDTKK